VRVVGAQGEQLGVLSIEQALEKAGAEGLDLVEVNPALDVRNATAEFATELALSALGKNIL